MKKIGFVLFALFVSAFMMSKAGDAKEKGIVYPISLTDGKDAAGEIIFEDPAFFKYLQKAEFESGLYEGLPFDLDGDGFLSARECDLIRVISLNGKKNLCSLKGVEVFSKLRELYCGNTNIGELDLSGNSKLKILDCHNAKLLELDVTACATLEYLDVHGNGLTSLDLSQNQKLTYGDVSKQQRLAGEFEKDGRYYVELPDLDAVLNLKKVSQVEIDGAPGDGINSDYKETGEAVCSDFIKELSYEYETGWQDAKLAVTLQLYLGIRRIYDSQGGSRVPVQYYSKGAKDEAPIAPKKEGYDFKGWYTNIKCEGQPWTFGVEVTDFFTLYAKWEKAVVDNSENQSLPKENVLEEITDLSDNYYPDSYTIFYRTGTKKMINPVKGVVWESCGIVPKKKLKRKNYQFVGWKSVFTGKWVTYKTKLGKSISDGTEENIVLKAVWVKQYEKRHKRFKRYGIVYQIMKSSKKKCTVKVVACKKKKRKIPKKVFYNGRYYRVIHQKRLDNVK